MATYEPHSEAAVIVERKYPSGQVSFMVAATIRGERIRQTFATREEAETFAQQLCMQRRDIDLTHTPTLRAEAVRCFQKLAPHNVPLSQRPRHGPAEEALIARDDGIRPRTKQVDEIITPACHANR